MRKLGIALLVLFVLVIAAALAAPYFLDVNRYHERVQAEVQKRLGRTVSLGAMRLSILPLAIRVENAVIGEDPAFNTGKPFAQAGELYVSARLMPLLRRELEVSALELKSPRIEVVRSRQGTWNFASLGHTSQASNAEASPSAGGARASQQAPASGAPAPKPAEPQPQFSLAELKVTDGQLAITDWQQRQGRAVYDHIDLTLKDYAPGKPFTIEAAAHLPGAGAQRLEIAGRGGPLSQGSLAVVPFHGSISLDQVSLSGLQRFLSAPALAGTEAIASGKADLKNEHGTLEFSGSLNLENGRVRGVEIGYPVALDYSLADDLSNDVIRIAKADVKLGATPVSLIGTINLRPTPAQLDVKVTAANASIAEMARLASAFGVVFNPAMQIAGRITADVQARGAATQPALNGSLKASDLVITGKELPEAVKVPAVELALSPEGIKSNDFAAVTGATTVTASFALSNYQSPASIVNAGLRAQNAKLGELLNIARAYGISAVEGMSGTGAVSLDLHLQGPARDPGAMTYSGAGLLQNASLKVSSLTKPLQIKNANLRFAQNAAVLDQVALSVGQTNATGSLTIRNFTAPNVEFALSADKFDVGEWQQMMTNPPQPRASGQIVPSAYAAPTQENFLAKMTGGGTVNVGSVIYDQLLLADAQAKAALDRGIIRLAPVRAKLYGGEENGTIVVDTRTTPPTYSVTSTLDRVDANQLLSATSSLKRTLYGLLAANMSTSFTATSADSIARSLNGDLSLDLKNGKLAGIDLLHELANIGKFLGGVQAAKSFTNLVQLAGNFKVLNGVAHTDNLKVVIEGGTLAAIGDVNLADQSLNMKLTAVLSKAFSDRVGGTGIGGYMSTALANNKGELVLPVIVSGSLQKPRLAPDLQALAQMKLQNLLPSTSNPAAGILGSILEKQQQPANGAAAGQSSTQKGGVEGVLDLLKGNQQPKPQGNQGQGVAAPGTEQPQPSNAEPTNPVSDLLNSVLQQQQKKKKEQQQKPKENQPPPEPPKL